MTISRTVLCQLTTPTQNRNFCGSADRQFCMRAQLHDALIWAILRDLRLFDVFVSDALQLNVALEATWHRLDTHVLGPVQAGRAVDGALVLRHHVTALAGALLEVQMARDDEKNYSWIGYLGATVSHLRCPTALCIVTCRPDVVTWAATVLSERPSAITCVRVLGPAEWLALALQFPEHALYQLMAWLCGYLHDQIFQNTRHLLDAILALDSAEGRGYLYLVQAVAQRLPPPYQEFVMNEMKDYRFLFPIHDIEYEWMEKGIEKGERMGRLDHAKATLARIDANAAAALASCEDVRVIDEAIDAAFRRLSAGRSE
jgi:hypothetical protein